MSQGKESVVEEKDGQVCVLMSRASAPIIGALATYCQTASPVDKTTRIASQASLKAEGIFCRSENTYDAPPYDERRAHGA